MAFTAKQLRRSLRQLGVNATDRELPEQARAAGWEVLDASWQTEQYTDPDDGGKHVRIAFVVNPKATMLKVAIFRAYVITNARNRARAFMAALGVCARTFLVQAEWSAESESLGFAIEMPVMDGTLTTDQIGRMVGGLLTTLDTYDPVMRHAMEDGVVDFSLVRQPDESDDDEEEDDN